MLDDALIVAARRNIDLVTAGIAAFFAAGVTAQGAFRGQHLIVSPEGGNDGAGKGVGLLAGPVPAGLRCAHLNL